MINGVTHAIYESPTRMSDPGKSGMTDGEERPGGKGSGRSTAVGKFNVEHGGI